MSKQEHLIKAQDLVAKAMIQLIAARSDNHPVTTRHINRQLNSLAMVRRALAEIAELKESN